MKKSSKKMKAEGMLIPAGLLIGIGVGMLYHQIAPGTLIGLGVGFLATWIASRKGS